MRESEIVAQSAAIELRVARQATRLTFFDPKTRLSGESVSPDGANTGMNVTKVVLPPEAEAPFPAEAYISMSQSIWVLDGQLTTLCGPETEILGAGDCMSLGPPTAVTFKNATERYATHVMIVRRH
ncbi:hypothetical protein [Paracoccus sp. Ld10]|uniref:hypothetical protein n=1 Tax=Paracoccus sp. Ld10 TaxID=649158 RepID=UPI00386576A4